MRPAAATSRQPEALDPTRAEELTVLLRAIAHPLRLRILEQLCRREQHVNQLVALLDAKQSIVSQQLRILRMSRIVEVRRQSGFAVYRIANPHLHDLFECIRECPTR
jgi:DNA-binding transcriptional ArsR family regulator